MASGLQKRERHDEVSAMRSTARLRSRVLAILQAGQERAGITQVDMAARLGVRKSAVYQVLHGAGNIQIDTLGEYLAALGLEADLVVAELGEFRNARTQRRAPVTIALTVADHDRVDNGSLVIEIKMGASQNGNAALRITEAKQKDLSVGGLSKWS